MRVVFRKTVVGDRRFDYLSGSHLQSQVKSSSGDSIYASGRGLIGQFCHELIGRQDLKLQ